MNREETLEKQIDDYKKMNAAKNAFLAGIIRGWVERLQQHDTEKQACITDMLDFSNMIAKSAGVIISDDRV